MLNFPTLQGTVKELCHYKVLKMGQNLHANMEVFRRASHIYALTLYNISNEYKVVYLIVKR